MTVRGIRLAEAGHVRSTRLFTIGHDFSFARTLNRSDARSVYRFFFDRESNAGRMFSVKFVSEMERDSGVGREMDVSRERLRYEYVTWHKQQKLRRIILQ